MSSKNFGYRGGTRGRQVHHCARSHFVITTDPTCLIRKVTNFKFAVTQNEGSCGGDWVGVAVNL